MWNKNEQIGFRLPAGLKKQLQEVARLEGRTLSQVCEMFLAGGLESYRSRRVREQLEILVLTI
jgi:hypothetical protein